VPSIAAVEQQILAREGFRVRITPLDPKAKSLPAYAFTVMAPQRWKLSEWKSVRLREYVLLVRKIDVLAPNGSEIKSDLQLGNVRDKYYEAAYGAIDGGEPPPSKVTQIRSSRKR
jgi:hypothetical protein